MNSLTGDPHGEYLESYACERCNPFRPTASKSRTLLNITGFIILQLKICNFNVTTAEKLVPNLQIEQTLKAYFLEL